MNSNKGSDDGEHAEPRAGRLESQLVDTLRRKQHSFETEKLYVSWYKRYVRFHEYVHPAEMGAEEIEAFLTHLARNKKVAPSTQNQALSALVFLYKHVLKIKVEGIDAIRAKEKEFSPVVLTVPQTKRLISAIPENWRLKIGLLYGCGLRISECLDIRIKDLDLCSETLTAYGKGGKSRALSLPERLREPLERQVAEARKVYDADRAAGEVGVSLPHAFAQKSPSAATSWPWFWLWPAAKFCNHPQTGERCRYRLGDSGGTRAIRAGLQATGIVKRVTAHTFRHSFATHLLLDGIDLRTVQELLGHTSIKTTEKYVKLARAMRGDVRSPLDKLWD